MKESAMIFIFFLNHFENNVQGKFANIIRTR